ncbi:MAG: hypothetical protein WCY29_02070 [Novosphingobium sp.]
MTTITFGSFIQPDRSLEMLDEPNAKLGCVVHSGFRAMNQAPGIGLLGENRIFDAIWQRWTETPLECEDQCSAQYYFDLVRTLRDFNGEFGHVVEVGCYLGGATSILAGCMDRFDFTLDIVDVSAPFLQYSYERVRRMYPEAAGRVRLFYGDLPSYVREVMLPEPREGVIVHHDGAHDFNQVVKDMASLSYVREQLHAIIAQDTHLRGTVHHMNFVDMALYAVFGTDLNYCPIGARYDEFDYVTRPNRYQGNYFVAGQPEGFVLPMAVNSFRYPHPELSMEDFLPAPVIRDQAA